MNSKEGKKSFFLRLTGLLLLFINIQAQDVIITSYNKPNEEKPLEVVKSGKIIPEDFWNYKVQPSSWTHCSGYPVVFDGDQVKSRTFAIYNDADCQLKITAELDYNPNVLKVAVPTEMTNVDLENERTLAFKLDYSCNENLKEIGKKK